MAARIHQLFAAYRSKKNQGLAITSPSPDAAAHPAIGLRAIFVWYADPITHRWKVLEVAALLEKLHRGKIACVALAAVIGHFLLQAGSVKLPGLNSVPRHSGVRSFFAWDRARRTPSAPDFHYSSNM